MAAAEGGYLARHGLAKEEGIPVYTLVAVTPQHLFAFRAERDHLVGFKAGEPFATWERDHIDISVHARAKVRTFEIHDLKTDEKYEMERRASRRCMGQWSSSSWSRKRPPRRGDNRPPQLWLFWVAPVVGGVLGRAGLPGGLRRP
jgi:hypothetical protein